MTQIAVTGAALVFIIELVIQPNGSYVCASSANRLLLTSTYPVSNSVGGAGGTLSFGPAAGITTISSKLVNASNPLPKSTSGVVLKPAAISVV